MIRKLSITVIVLLALGLLVIPALAGGWALVTVENMPPEIRAGEPVELHMTVWQHGQTPVHFFDTEENPIVPRLIATNQVTGERIEATAERLPEVGEFTLTVTFPSDGTWTWDIRPEPLESMNAYKPLTVMPAIQAGAVEQKAVAEPVKAAVQTDAAVAPAQPKVESVVEPVVVAAVEPATGVSPMQAALWVGAGVVGLLVVLFLAMRRRSASHVWAIEDDRLSSSPSQFKTESQ